MDGLGVVQQSHVEIGAEGLDLVEIEGGEEAVSPAEGCVRVDDDVLVLVGDAENLLEDRTAESVEPGDGEIEDSALRHVRGFGVHHFSDVADFDVQAMAQGLGFDGFQIGAFFYADLSCNESSHLFNEHSILLQ